MDPVTVIIAALDDATGTAAGKYRVDIRDTQGIQVGDHNTQNLNLGGSADR